MNVNAEPYWRERERVGDLERERKGATKRIEVKRETTCINHFRFVIVVGFFCDDLLFLAHIQSD